jgi:activator of 2-hydroxyglutaryl-CoA dehydratase
MLLAGIINKQVSDLCLQQHHHHHHQLHGHNKFLTQNRSTSNKQQQQQLMICCCSSRTVMMRAHACNTKSKNKEWVLAIDVGTGGTKAALITSKGCVSTSAFSAHPPPSPSCL